jgi:hypothetical protein
MDFYLQFAKHMTDPSVGAIEETMWPPEGFVIAS